MSVSDKDICGELKRNVCAISCKTRPVHNFEEEFIEKSAK